MERQPHELSHDGNGRVHPPDARNPVEPHDRTPEHEEEELRDLARSEIARWRIFRVVTMSILVFWALQASRDVSLPVVAGILAATACYPLYHWLAPKITSVVAVLACTFVTLAFVGGICAGLGYCGQVLADHVIENKDRLRETWTQMSETTGLDLSSVVERLESAASSAAMSVTMGVAGLVLALAMMSLFLVDSEFARGWVSRRSDKARNIARGWEKLSGDLARYIVVRTGVGLLTGILTSVACWVLGIRLALVWGFVNFILNYIPTIGSILGVIPPVLFVLIDTGDWQQALIAVAAVGGVQLVMGNWIDPLVQGHYLKLAPSVVLVAVTLFGWLWGPGGALVAVPVCMLLIRVCEQRADTRPAAEFLAKRES